jgi:glycosyltransferase involved in cell wall biosynthesis
MVIPPWYRIPPRGYGGIEVVCAALVDALAARGHDVTVLGAGRTTGTSGRFLSTMEDLQHTRLGEATPAVLHAARVDTLLRRYRFDIVHDHSPAGPLTAAYRLAPTVVTVHGAVDGQLGELLAEVGDSIHPVAISDAQRRLRALPWAGTVHNGIDTTRLLHTATAHDGPVLWLARFSPDKGPDLAIRACREAGMPLVLAGKCSEASEIEYLRSVVRPMLGDDVKLVVNADRPTTQRLLERARCLLLPIRWHEPFGMVMIEAMARGTPVVALRRGSVPEIVRNGITGFVCDDPATLSTALRRVVDLDPADSVAHVRSAFGADLMARRYEAVYRRVLARAGRRQYAYATVSPSSGGTAAG